jgi:hypothetical protein
MLRRVRSIWRGPRIQQVAPNEKWSSGAVRNEEWRFYTFNVERIWPSMRTKNPSKRKTA